MLEIVFVGCPPRPPRLILTMYVISEGIGQLSNLFIDLCIMREGVVRVYNVQSTVTLISAYGKGW